MINDNLEKDLAAIKTVQYEHLIWTNHNFPGQIPQDPTLGIVEEYGEYVDAFATGKRSDIKDALADMAIFTIAVANHYRIYAADELATVVNGHGSMRPIESRLGALCHAVLKHQQGIRKNESHLLAIKLNLGLLLEWIRFKAHGLRMDFGEILTEVWRRVRDRDWTKETNIAPEKMEMVDALTGEVQFECELTKGGSADGNFEMGAAGNVGGTANAENGGSAIQHGKGA